MSAVPPGAGAAAMATGIVSVALHLADIEWFSRIWLVIGAGIWAVLVGVFLTRLVGDRARWVAEADTPAALTAVAATTVLGTRVAPLGWDAIAVLALCLAALVWAVLMPAVIGHWTGPTVGAHFLLCVATQGLVVLGATLAVALPASWLTPVAAATFVLGLIAYLVVLSRFSFAQFKTGAGDHWVCAGGLAISALAAGKLIVAMDAAGWNGWPHTVIRVAAAVILALDLAGYVALVICEVRWPRLGFDVRRWSTAFPMGMTAAATITVADAIGAPWLRSIGLVLIWPAAVVCVILLVASAGHLVSAGSADTSAG
ncbi:tellurite resistance protein TehA-like permease [Rhodococcus sp. PvR044]|uniref:tellurite resistance/C4-dicarboxylate transporter family protein n=1 Tax=Rhodococcus TaxID=1827 RepID=UPI000BC6C75E|nr:MULTISPECIES: tellurite resistance/C4-dicarboxylate transporter family protein [Rhodococcus]MBP1158362.1 tellurite resistance protein TehA-like permease [Rhodococcus sp. PvR099]MCZ4554087.1 tellurite resistance/C4-dicarboxylate transporter family protein [Rhodococcus maanshanensis]PTR43787.1 voltage-gated anion channel [Rhodococcus sp. OK611]SNX90605.1 Voltage-dependent anion channel [Rhodococcus sp. OK270]